MKRSDKMMQFLFASFFDNKNSGFINAYGTDLRNETAIFEFWIVRSFGVVD
jgi:hypothetical protein